jgi:ADP-ribose pyrophosphatase YjhB (NUDIX family)
METIEETFVREVYEETGLEVKMGCLVFIADVIDPHPDLHVINLVFHGLVTGGTFRATPTGSFSPIENQDCAYYLPVSSLDKERIYPAIAAPIQKAHEIGFPSDALYLGNVWAAFADEAALK